MSRETEVATLLRADAAITAILTGGIYTYEETGIDGITRELVPTAFDANGWLLPCLLVKQRGDVADNMVRGGNSKDVSTLQVVELWFYQDKGSYAAIDSARKEAKRILEGEILPDSFPMQIGNVLDRQHDNGALNGASMANVEYAINSVS